MYILRIISIRSYGKCNSSPITYHSFSRFIESYALRRSMKANPSCYFVLILCWMMVYRISACSVVVWCARKPAWVGACRLRVFAEVVSRAFMVAINTLAKGGGWRCYGNFPGL
jgi:hypothetical protein